MTLQLVTADGKPIRQLPSVVIGYPSGDMVHAEFSMCLAALSRMYGGKLGWVNSRHSIIANGRNNIVDQIQRLEEMEYLFFLDSDIVFPMDILEALLSHKKDIVGCVYNRRAPPFDVLGLPKDGKSLSVENGLVEMDALPTGCMLIKMSVFRKLTKPYFRGEVIEGETFVKGEDYSFCKAAREAGYRIWADIDASKKIGHIGQRIYMTGLDVEKGAGNANAATA